MRIFRYRFIAVILTLSSCITSSYASTQSESDPWHVKAETMLKQAVKIPTVVGQNRVPELAQYLAEQFRSAGIPDQDIHIIPYNETAALIVRWRAANPSLRAMESRRRGRVVPGSLRAGCFSAGKI